MAAQEVMASMGMPVGSHADATSKIHPFKLFRGRQPVYIDGASSFVVNPNVFGPGSLWAVIQAPGYTYDPAAMQDVWSTILTKGAQAAGQISSTTTLAPFDTATGKGWEFRGRDQQTVGLSIAAKPGREC
jgi:hypothetical protein